MNQDELQEHVQEQQPEVQEEQSQELQAQQKKDVSAAENLKRLREKADRAERERDEAVRIVKELKERSSSTEDDLGINADELVEGKHLSKVSKKIRKLEEEIGAYKAHSEQVAIESRIKNTYNDFDKIVSEESITRLKEEYPELAESIINTPNLYNKAVAAYTMIKKLGIVSEDKFDQERQLAQKNANKPRTLTSISPQQGDTPLSRANAFANGLTDDLKSELRREMEEARKNY